MLIKLGIIILATLGLIFVVMPFFDRGVFDFQCEPQGCSSQVCGARTIFGSSKTMTTCEYKPEYGCLKSCGIRSGKCGFDPIYEENCMKCIQKCPILDENLACYQECYDLNITVS